MKPKGNTVIVSVLLAALLIAMAAVTAGCSSQSTPQTATPTVTSVTTQATPLAKSTAIDVSAPAPTRLYQVDGSCRYESTVEVYNKGQIDYTNIAIRLDLVDKLLGSVRDTYNIDIERIVPDNRKVFPVQFSGECDREYWVRFEVS